MLRGLEVGNQDGLDLTFGHDLWIVHGDKMIGRVGRQVDGLEVLVDAAKGGAGHVGSLVREKGEIVAEIFGNSRHTLLLYCLHLADHKIKQDPASHVRSFSHGEYRWLWGL